MREKQTIVYLVRHGEVTNPLQLIYGRLRDVPLSQDGQKKVERTAQLILQTGDIPAAFFVSPRKRTEQTARIVAKLFPPAPFFYRDELSEVNSTGIVGRSLSWFRGLGNMYDEAIQRRYHFWVETEQAQADRMNSVIYEIVRSFPGQTAVLVSHGHPLAFAFDALRSQNHSPRSIEILKQESYLLRGQAWRLVFSPSLAIMEIQMLTG